MVIMQQTKTSHTKHSFTDSSSLIPMTCFAIDGEVKLEFGLRLEGGRAPPRLAGPGDVPRCGGEQDGDADQGGRQSRSAVYPHESSPQVYPTPVTVITIRGSDGARVGWRHRAAGRR